MLEKIIVWPLVFFVKFILITIEFVIWTPLELFGLTNPRSRYVVKIRSLNQAHPNIKTYKPWGLVGAPDKYFIKQRMTSGDFMYYTEETIISLYECNISIREEEKLFVIPKVAFDGVNEKEELKTTLETQDWIYVRDMYKNKEPKITTEIVVKEVIKEVIKEVPSSIKAPVKKKVLPKPKVININQPVNKMGVHSINELLRVLGLFNYKTLTIGEKIQLIRTTKLRTSKTIKKLEDKTYYNFNTDLVTLNSIAEKLFIKASAKTTDRELRALINAKIKLIKGIKFN